MYERATLGPHARGGVAGVAFVPNDLARAELFSRALERLERETTRVLRAGDAGCDGDARAGLMPYHSSRPLATRLAHG